MKLNYFLSPPWNPSIAYSGIKFKKSTTLRRFSSFFFVRYIWWFFKVSWHLQHVLHFEKSSNMPKIWQKNEEKPCSVWLKPKRTLFHTALKQRITWSFALHMECLVLFWSSSYHEFDKTTLPNSPIFGPHYRTWIISKIKKQVHLYFDFLLIIQVH